MWFRVYFLKHTFLLFGLLLLQTALSFSVVQKETLCGFSLSLEFWVNGRLVTTHPLLDSF